MFWPSTWGGLPKLAKGFRDRHHVLEVFGVVVVILSLFDGCVLDRVRPPPHTPLRFSCALSDYRGPTAIVIGTSLR